MIDTQGRICLWWKLENRVDQVGWGIYFTHSKLKELIPRRTTLTLQLGDRLVVKDANPALVASLSLDDLERVPIFA